MSKFYDLTPLDTKGDPFPFSQFKGKVVLVVNVASKCGFTKQYKGLEELYEKFKGEGFEVVGFPCNQFGGQEPGSDAEVQTFCSTTYGVTFPILKKVEVNGDNADEVYKYLKHEKAGIFGLTRIKWNFEKFLINKEGKVVNRWASTTSPESIIPEVSALLKK